MPSSGRSLGSPGGNQRGGPPNLSSQGPTVLPLPEPVANFWKAAGKTAFQHPIYPLLRAIRWHEGWRYDAPRGSSAPGVKASAYAEARDLLRRREVQELARAVRDRRAAWVESLVRDGRARRLLLRAASDFVLHLSSPGPLELGMAVHHVYGFPFVPGTALKGLAHAVARAEDASLAEALYGRQEAAGGIAILDGLPVRFEVHRDVMTPHFPEWYRESAGAKPDDTEDPKPIPFLSVAAGSEFEVVLIARAGATASGDLDAVERHLRLGCDERGLGAKTSAGYGAFVVARLEQPAPVLPRADAKPAPPSSSTTPPQPRPSPGPARLVDALMGQVKALPPNRVAGEINKFVDDCLKLEDEEDQKALARAIVEKMTPREIRKRIKEGKRPDQWRRILDLAGVQGD